MQFPTLLLPTDTPSVQILATVIPFTSLENNPDIVHIGPLEEKSSISIDQVHELQGPLQYRPIKESYKVVIITKAHLLTLPAQQALLKTLEEPPENTQLILATHLPSKLLPTILSRATLVQSAHEKGSKEENSIWYDMLEKQSVSQSLRLSDEWSKTRESAITQLQVLLVEVRTRTHAGPEKKLLKDERAIITCIEQLEKNVNVKLALDHLFLSLAGHV